MRHPPFRGPRERLGGLYHLGRLLDKIRLHQRGALPEEYRPNFGLSIGLDGYLCGFLGVEFDALCARVREGGTDEQIVEWCFARGLRPNKVQTRVWNEYARKLGWNDRVSQFIAGIHREDGTTDRPDLVTAFDVMDQREGRPLHPVRRPPPH